MKVEILGSVQDGGVPHLGCECDMCEEARSDARSQKYVGALMIKENDDNDSVRYLVDATPDIRFQIKGDYLDGVFLSQGQLGHVGGLPFFGTESLDTSQLSVYCTSEMEQFLMKNDPFRLLIDRNQIDVESQEDGGEVDIQGGEVEFRNVLDHYVNTDTASLMVKGPKKKLYYLSDVNEWTDDAISSIEEADIAVVDGTFWNRKEIDRYEEVPHPTMQETMDRMEDFDTDIYFIHLNHTNPALREDSDEREEIEDRGFEVVEKGMEFEI